MLWGRRQQCEALDGLLAEVRAGRSRALVTHGEAGIGKTALLGYAAETAPDCRVARLLATGERVRNRTTIPPPRSAPGRPRSPGWPATACQTQTSPPSCC
jgi:hypothetical protein